MSAPKMNALEILKKLNKSNCGECGAPACMAFAALVCQGGKKLNDCPYLDEQAIAELVPNLGDQNPPDEDPGRALEELRGKMRELDFQKVSEQLGIPLIGDRLRVHVLGRVFDVDQTGALHTLSHVNGWIYAPLLDYLINGQGKEPVGSWTPYPGLKNAQDWARFFTHRCEKALERLAQSNDELFFDILDIFGTAVDGRMVDADRSFLLMPLPRVPVLFSYWEAEGEIPSKLALHFDETATANLQANSIFYLLTGMTEMFTRFTQTHGVRVAG
jgi:Domain of unknown function (DUF3786)/Putative Fe-S cluster